MRNGSFLSPRMIWQSQGRRQHRPRSAHSERSAEGGRLDRSSTQTGRCSDVQKETVEKQSMKVGKYVGIAFASAIFTTGCGRHVEADPRTEPELVRIVVVEPSQGASQFFTGVVSARVQSDLGFRVSGKITRRVVGVGQHVHTAQPPIRIDATG